jgi:hypothetical protein
MTPVASIIDTGGNWLPALLTPVENSHCHVIALSVNLGKDGNSCVGETAPVLHLELRIFLNFEKGQNDANWIIRSLGEEKT